MVYEPQQVSYDELLDLFFQRIDPTQRNRQGNDVGTQYRTGIYYHDEQQRAAAEARIAKASALCCRCAATTDQPPALNPGTDTLRFPATSPSSSSLTLHRCVLSDYAHALRRLLWRWQVNEALAAQSSNSLLSMITGKKKVESELKPAGDYYLAENYHQQYLAKGGRFGRAQSAAKGCNDPIRCYG